MADEIEFTTRDVVYFKGSVVRGDNVTMKLSSKYNMYYHEESYYRENSIRIIKRVQDVTQHRSMDYHNWSGICNPLGELPSRFISIKDYIDFQFRNLRYLGIKNLYH